MMTLEHPISVRTQKTVYRDGSHTIKVFREEEPKSEVMRVAMNQALAEATALSVPAVEEVTRIDGRWAIVAQYIPGKTLAELLEQEPAREAEHLARLVELQRLVQSQKIPMLVTLRDKLNYEISRSELDATERYDLHARLDELPRHAKLCHGDFIPSNIVFSDLDGKPYILDWSQATRGAASADAALTYLQFLLWGQEERARRYLDLFCREACTEASQVYAWLPMMAVSRLVRRNDPKEHDPLLAMLKNSIPG